jgi:hypothetical protein
MTIRYNVTGNARKKMVTAIKHHLSTDANYLGAPSFAFEIGEYTVSQNGTVSGPDNAELTAAIVAAGFTAEAEEYDAPAAETPAKADKSGLPSLYTLATPRGEIYIAEEFASRAEAEAEGYGEYFSTALGTIYSYNDDRTFALMTAHKAGDWDKTIIKQDFRTQPRDVPDYDSITIEAPLFGFTPETLDNLTKLVLSKEVLIKKALDAEELPIQVLDDSIAFPWFKSGVDSGTIEAYAQFIAALCATAKAKTRVTAKTQEFHENEKFSMRIFCIGLGLIGKEYSVVRKLMSKNLSGNSAFRYGPPEKAAPALSEDAPTEEASEVTGDAD